MIYLFPSAGLGSRLVNSGIKPPKPLVQVHGIELLLWSISSFTYKCDDSIVVVTLRSDNVKNLLNEKLSSLYPSQNIVWIELDSLSSGQLDTCIIALSELKSVGTSDQPLVIHNCDSSFDGSFFFFPQQNHRFLRNVEYEETNLNSEKVLKWVLKHKFISPHNIKCNRV